MNHNLERLQLAQRRISELEAEVERWEIFRVDTIAAINKQATFSERVINELRAEAVALREDRADLDWLIAQIPSILKDRASVRAARSKERGGESLSTTDRGEGGDGGTK